MNLNPIKAIITVYRNVRSALADPDSHLNLIGLELELREEELRAAATAQTPQVPTAEANTENVSHLQQSAE